MKMQKLFMNKMVVLTLMVAIVLIAHQADAWWWGKSAKAKEETASQPPALTLHDCYQLTLKQSETIAINEEFIKEADAHFLSALGIMLPHASFSSTDFKQDKLSPGGSSTSSSSVRARSSTRKFTVSQTLFNGFKEYAGVVGSGSERGQRKEELARAKDLLMGDVANAFYLYLQQQEDLKSLAAIESALKGRVTELRDRERLGRSRQSEVVNAQSQLYNVQAEIESVKALEVIACHLLEFLVGRPVGGVVDVHEELPAIQDRVYYLSQVGTRPDVVAAKHAWDVAKRQVTIAASGYFPSVNLEGNDYVQRTGSNKGIDWDVSLVVNVPIFEGTETLGAVKAAEAQAREAKLRYEFAKRSAAQDIQDAYVQYQTAILRHRALKKSMDTAELNYHLQKKDYRLNLVNNLDVLQAIQVLENAQRSYIQALYDSKRQYWQMRVAAGDAAPKEKR